MAFLVGSGGNIPHQLPAVKVKPSFWNQIQGPPKITWKKNLKEPGKSDDWNQIV